MANELEALRAIRQVNAGFPYTEPIRRWKKDGKKVIGYFCSYMPEEVFEAAGILPVRITGHARELQLDKANEIMYYNTCSFCRTALQLALEQQYDFLDGIVGSDTCFMIRTVLSNWLEYVKPAVPFDYFVDVPHASTEAAKRTFRSHLMEFGQVLGEFSGVAITDQSLKEAWQAHNTTRQLLRRLYESRKAAAPPISGAETVEVLNAAVRMPVKEYSVLLQKLVGELGTTNRQVGGKRRIMISGTPLNNPGFVKTIEDMGGLVVVDDTCTGTQYWMHPEDRGDADQWSAIATSYLDKLHCARQFPGEARIDQVMGLINDYRVDAVITHTLPASTCYAWQMPLLKGRLEEEKVPLLELNVVYGTSGDDDMKGWVEEFLKTLEPRKQSQATGAEKGAATK